MGLALIGKIPTGLMAPLQDLIPDLLVIGEIRLAQATSEQSAGFAAGIQSSVVLDVPFGSNENFIICFRDLLTFKKKGRPIVYCV